MTFAAEPAISVCISVEFGAFTDVVIFAGLIAIPAIAIPAIARIARRHPSGELLTSGRRHWGVRLHRWGLVVVAASILGFAAAVWIAINDTGSCETSPSGLVGFLSVVAGIVGALVVGGGWAIAIRAVWVVFATLATVDVWIFAISLVIGLDDPDAIAGLLLLAFAIHAICMGLAARWSFVARDLGPIERAKAGEAGRTLSAVWVFLASYSALALLRNENGIFGTAAGSAVIGALTLGALAATMGSGFTKYAEATQSKPPAPPTEVGPAALKTAALKTAESRLTATEPRATEPRATEPGATDAVSSSSDADAPGSGDD